MAINGQIHICRQVYLPQNFYLGLSDRTRRSDLFSSGLDVSSAPNPSRLRSLEDGELKIADRMRVTRRSCGKDSVQSVYCRSYWVDTMLGSQWGRPKVPCLFSGDCFGLFSFAAAGMVRHSRPSSYIFSGVLRSFAACFLKKLKLGTISAKRLLTRVYWCYIMAA